MFHTKYVGRTVETLNARFGYDVSSLRSSRDVLVLSAETGEMGNDLMLTNSEVTSLQRMRIASSRLVSISSSFLDEVAEQIAAKDQLTVGPRLKIYFNTYVRQGRRVTSATRFVQDFKAYFEGEVMKAVDKVKQPKTKAAKLKKLYEGMEFIENNENALMKTVGLYTTLQNAKLFFIRKLERGEELRTYLRTEDGYKVTAPEGYVAIREDSTAVKLVDRLSFSVANFNVSKDWVAGDK